MTIVLGTNAGFVNTAPTTDPAGFATTQIDTKSIAVKDTSPIEHGKITEIGWYCQNATQESNFEVGIYSHDSDNDRPGTLIGSATINAKGTGLGWKTASVDISIDESTIYWIAIQVDDTSTNTQTDISSASGQKHSIWSSQTTLQSNWTNTSNENLLMPFYAVWEEDEDESSWDISTASYDSKSFDFSSEEIFPQDIFFKPDGLKMYVIGWGSIHAHQYTLSIPWDVSTASYDSKSFNIAPLDWDPTSIFFKLDGLKMYVIGRDNNSVYQYTLSIPWDVSTANYDSKLFDFSSEDDNISDAFFKPDGTKLYSIDNSGNAHQYTLSIPWDVSTANYDSKLFDFSSEDTGIVSIFFKPDGSKMYVAGFDNNSVYQYTLSTPWDISTTSYDSKLFDFSSEDDNTAIFFKPDGSKMYMAGFDNDFVYQYSISPVVYSISFGLQSINGVQSITL